MSEATRGTSKTAKPRAALPKPQGRPRNSAPAAAASGPALSVGDRVALLLDDVEGEVTKSTRGWYEVSLETGATANFRKGELRLVRRGTKRPAATAEAPSAQRPADGL